MDQFMTIIHSVSDALIIILVAVSCFTFSCGIFYGIEAVGESKDDNDRARKMRQGVKSSKFIYSTLAIMVIASIIAYIPI